MIDIKDNYQNKAKQGNTHDARRQNPLFILRAFNNWLKSVLISQTAASLKSKLKKDLDLKTAEQVIHVLDIGCGKGGDIEKWSSAGVKAVVGLDFSSQSLIAYKERLSKKARNPFKSCMVCRDCGVPPVEFFKGFKGLRFDIVSAQFSMHYSFDTQQRAKNLIGNMAGQLLAGGLIIATIPDAYTICKKVFQQKNRQKDGSFLWDNRNMAILFEPPFEQSCFGMEYKFFIEGTLGKKEGAEISFVKQWLIDLIALEKLLKENGCRLLESYNFIDYYSQYKEKYHDQMRRFGLVFDPNTGMDNELWEDAHLYRIVIAEKVSGTSIGEYSLHQRHAMLSGLPEKVNF